MSPSGRKAIRAPFHPPNGSILFTARPDRLLVGMGTKNGVRAEPFGRLAFQLALGFALALSGGTPTATECPLVVTQCPVPAQTDSVPRDVLDLRYPTGSRLMLMRAPFEPQQSECLSTGLSAAGDPVISPDGRRVLFPGKAQVDRAWQIYEAALPGGHPRALTSMPGGAMDPALLPDGRLIFASPVPAAVPGDSNHSLPALYWATAGAEPVQLSFSSVAITEPVVLSDGRILFISPRPATSPSADLGLALYTINNDGTEITAFSGQHDVPRRLGRPRQLADGRLVCLAAAPEAREPGGSPEMVRMARPFQSRTPLFPTLEQTVRSVEPEGDDALLVCARVTGSRDRTERGRFVVFHVPSSATTLGEPLFSAPGWDSVEAVPAVPARRAMGRLSMVDLAKRTGQVLCLDVNDTSYRLPEASPARTVARVRVLAGVAPGKAQAIGEVAVQPDGSFMAEVPANLPLGFEALDAQGRVLRREAPMIWVRPGENRSCIGCHEAHNHSPRNHRPQAVTLPVPRLELGRTHIAQNGAEP